MRARAARPRERGDDRAHRVIERLHDTARHLRLDIEKMHEPQFKSMFETAAQTLDGLAAAFRRYEHNDERVAQAHQARDIARFTSVNPATGAVIGSYEGIDAARAADIVELTHQAFGDWRARSFADRAACMQAAARILRDRANDYARLMAGEMGKPVKEGVAEAEKCALACDYFAEQAERFLTPEMVETEATKSFVAFRPLGAVLAIMPWNFPFWQVFRFAAPALMAGNGAVLKHASNVPGCALAIEDVFRQAGFPDHLFRVLMVGSSQVDAIIAHPRIRAVTLTGSGPAGRAVARKAGEMLKKTVLELGGSDPYLVLEDADVGHAAMVSAKGRLINSGQSCIAAKRFIVVGK